MAACNVLGEHMKLSKIFSTFFISGLASQVFAVSPEGKNPLADLPYFNKTESGYSLKFNDKIIKQ